MTRTVLSAEPETTRSAEGLNRRLVTGNSCARRIVMIDYRRKRCQHLPNGKHFIASLQVLRHPGLQHLNRKIHKPKGYHRYYNTACELSANIRCDAVGMRNVLT